LRDRRFDGSRCVECIERRKIECPHLTERLPHKTDPCSDVERRIRKHRDRRDRFEAHDLIEVFEQRNGIVESSGGDECAPVGEQRVER